MNFEEQLRNALHDEAESIASPDSDVTSIRTRGRRRKAWKAAVASFALVAVVGGGAIGIAAIARGPSDPLPLANSTTDAPPMTTTTTMGTPTTTVIPVTTTTTEPTTTTSWPPAPPVFVAVATTESEAPTGLSTIDVSGTITPIIEGRFHVAGSDGSGGLVFQAQVATEDVNRERGSIYRVAAGTVDPVPIVEQPPGHVIVMQAVERIDGTPTLLYTDSYSYESPATARIVVMAYDLTSGESREIAVVGTFESGVHSVSYGAGIILVETTSEIAASWLFLDPVGAPVAAPFNPLVACELGDVRCPSAPTMAPDGTLIYVRSAFFDSEGNELDLSGPDYVLINDEGMVSYQGGESTLTTDFVERTEVIAVNLDSGSTRLLRSFFNERTEGEDGGAFLSLDFDGRYLIVNDRKQVPSPPALVFDTEDVAFGLPLSIGGEAFFPLVPFDLGGVVASPIGS